MSQSSLDPMHFAVVRLDTYAGDVQLETATGFFVAGEREGVRGHSLVTNWHVLSGRNPLAPGVIRHAGGGLPDNIRFTLHQLTEDPNAVRLEEVSIHLYGPDGEALWNEHRGLGRRLDVGCIDLRDQLATGYRVEGVNVIAGAYDMRIQLGSEAYIIGYPHGFSHFARTPIWKRGSIASEPHLGEEGDNDRVVIDATTREGMSGSPVVLRASTHYLSEAGDVRQAPGAMRWIGVYSSRPTFGNRSARGQEITAEIGYFVKSGRVVEMLGDMKPASSRDQVPE